MMRFPPRRILAAVDDTPASRRAWAAACDLAARFGARLVAVHCEPPLSPELAAYTIESAHRRRVAATIRRRVGPKTRLHTVPGWPEEVLPRLAKDRRCDLIVIGTTLRSALGRAVKGSVAEAVVRSSPCPVLIVPRRRLIRRVLAPVNDGEYARDALAAAAVVARAYRAKLELLHVVTDPLFGTPPRSLLRRRLQELPPSLRRGASRRSVLSRDGAVADILREARGRDLIVLAEHRKSALGDWALGTTAERVLRRSTVPVLAIPPRRRRRGFVIL